MLIDSDRLKESLEKLITGKDANVVDRVSDITARTAIKLVEFEEELTKIRAHSESS